MLPQEVFLSHSDQNRDFVDELAGVLQRHGIPTWYSRQRILGAAQWHDEIGQALQRCDWFVLVLSTGSVGSSWVKRELLFALNEKRFEGRIVPVLFQPCDIVQLSWTLPGFQIVDFTTKGRTDGYRELLRVWGLGFES
ncbi:MAG: toll/interleukin-1 receptor domain-containing protein [Thermoanaerobaculia bacterium]